VKRAKKQICGLLFPRTTKSCSMAGCNWEVPSPAFYSVTNKPRLAISDMDQSGSSPGVVVQHNGRLSYSVWFSSSVCETHHIDHLSLRQVTVDIQKNPEQESWVFAELPTTSSSCSEREPVPATADNPPVPHADLPDTGDQDHPRYPSHDRRLPDCYGHRWHILVWEMWYIQCILSDFV